MKIYLKLLAMMMLYIMSSCVENQDIERDIDLGVLQLNSITYNIPDKFESYEGYYKLIEDENQAIPIQFKIDLDQSEYIGVYLSIGTDPLLKDACMYKWYNYSEHLNFMLEKETTYYYCLYYYTSEKGYWDTEKNSWHCHNEYISDRGSFVYKEGTALMDIKKLNLANLVTTGIDAVDMGLSVKWASKNLGAETIQDRGKAYYWGDPTGESWFKGENPPACISGTEYDIARAKLGGTWRLPTIDECYELMSQCFCMPYVSNGVQGMLVIGKKGDNIFLPYYSYESSMNFWTGTLQDKDMGAVWSIGNSYTIGRPIDSRLRIRPVCD